MDEQRTGEQPPPRPLALLLFTVLCTAGLLSWHLSMYLSYPFYLMWDMNQMTTVDMLLIQGGFRPDHINHTGFGMNLLLFLSQKIGHAAGWLSVLRIDELASCLNPLAAVAESADYVRLHSPLLSLGTALILSLALRSLFRLPVHYCLVFFVIFGIQESFTYHSTLIRTELYSAFYWSCAVLTLSLPARYRHGPARRLQLVAAGLLLGLAFLTKVQSLTYVVAAVLLALAPLFAHPSEDQQPPPPATPAGRNAVLALGLLTLAAFAAIGIMAQLAVVPPGVPTWARAFRPNTLAYVLYAGLAAIAAGSAFTLKRGSPAWLGHLTASLTLLTFGVLLATGLHFVLFRDPGVAWNYLLLDFKMIFLRKTELFEVRNVGSGLSELIIYFQHNPTTLLVHAVLLVGSLVAWRRGWLRLGRTELSLWILVSLIAVANVAFGTRFLLRDTLWRETLVNFASLAWFALLLTRSVRHRDLLRYAGFALLSLLLLGNVKHSLQTIDRADTNHNLYGWRIDRWFVGTFGGNNMKYSDLVFRRYDSASRSAAMAAVRDHRVIRQTVDFVFKNQRVDHRSIGLLSEGFSTWSGDLDFRLTSVPQQLRGSILVDAARVPANRGLLLSEERVSVEEEYLEKLKPTASNRIALLTRADLGIFVFVPASAVGQLRSRQLVETPFRALLKKGAGVVELQALEVKSYVELPPERLGPFSFVVIHSRLSDPGLSPGGV